VLVIQKGRGNGPQSDGGNNKSKLVLMVRQRHIPLRRCLACGTQRPQGELIRLVRKPEGQVSVNVSRNISGRGAYLCYSKTCWDQGLKRNRLEHVLRGPLSAAERETLANFANTMPMRA
jgi:predicted RNA-binding protein YlxR (DUF448 family)